MHEQLGLLFAVERFYQSIDNLDTLECFQAEKTVNSLGDRRTHVTKIFDVLIHVISVNEEIVYYQRHSLLIINKTK